MVLANVHASVCIVTSAMHTRLVTGTAVMLFIIEHLCGYKTCFVPAICLSILFHTFFYCLSAATPESAQLVHMAGRAACEVCYSRNIRLLLTTSEHLAVLSHFLFAIFTSIVAHIQGLVDSQGCNGDRTNNENSC